jgi:hypothetical protein
VAADADHCVIDTATSNVFPSLSDISDGRSGTVSSQRNRFNLDFTQYIFMCQLENVDMQLMFVK